MLTETQDNVAFNDFDVKNESERVQKEVIMA